MFHFFSKKPKVDHTQIFQDDIISLLEAFQKALASHHKKEYALALQRIQECLGEIKKPNISILKIALRVKCLIKEIGMMLYDRQFTLTSTEEELWRSIKDCNGKHDNIGHGVGLGL